MASMTVTIPDNQAARIVDAFAFQASATPTTLEEGMAIVQQAVFRYLRDQTLLYEAQQAREAVLTNPDDPLVDAVVTQGEG